MKKAWLRLTTLPALVALGACGAQPPVSDSSDVPEHVARARSALSASRHLTMGGSGCCNACTGTGNCAMGSTSIPFTDPAGAGHVPTSVSATVSSIGCAVGTATFALNDVSLGSLPYTRASCLCGGACLPVPQMVYHQRAGIPGYVPGGTNTFAIHDTSGLFVTFDVDLTFSDELTIAPASGPVSGGGTVTITGPSLPAGTPTSITFGGTPGTQITRVDAQTITVTAPAAAPSTVDVIVKFPTAVLTFAREYSYSTLGSRTALASSANPSLAGQPLTLDAHVAPDAAQPATGTVTFVDGSTVLGTAALDGRGHASLVVTALAAGAHAITALYGGDTAVLPSASPALAQEVGRPSTTITIAASANPAAVGAAVTFTASMAASSGRPSGALTFLDGPTPLGTAMLDDTGTATFTTSALAAGGHAITATYAGDDTFPPSTSAAMDEEIGKDGTTVTVAASRPSALVGEPVTFRAIVGAPAGDLAGDVELFDGAASLGTATLAGGTAWFETAALTEGVHAITAVYRGDPRFAGSTSAPFLETIRAADDADAGAPLAIVNAGGSGGCTLATMTHAGANDRSAAFALLALGLIGVRRRRH